jgi:predicted ATPase
MGKEHIPMSKLNFYTLTVQNRSLPRGTEYPAFSLISDNWNDYGAVTTYLLYVHLSKEKEIYIGGVKILHKDRLETELPRSFGTLDDSIFCSLGQSVDYYKKLREISDSISPAVILDALNDIALHPGLRNRFEGESHYTKSLLRFSEAEKALYEGSRIVKGIPIENAFNFGFSCQMEGADLEHFVNFDFNKQGFLPGRTIALVGQNGTGKTQFLARLASALSGLSEGGHFNTPHRPSFSKVLSISYSLFDDFEIPENTKTFSYVYCGLRGKEGLIGEEERIEKMEQARGKVLVKDRALILQKYFKKLASINNANVEFDFFSDNIQEFSKTFSSGQSILFYILTEIVANIEPESLILFDEPEIHLHPEAISQLVNILNDILEKFDSYAIIATHSPIVIQEIPAKYIYIFERENNRPGVRRLGIESFGENITAITENIFQTINVEENYKQVLRTLSQIKNYEQVNELFENRLSFNAKVYLRTLYNETT